MTNKKKNKKKREREKLIVFIFGIKISLVVWQVWETDELEQLWIEIDHEHHAFEEPEQIAQWESSRGCWKWAELFQLWEQDGWEQELKEALQRRDLKAASQKLMRGSLMECLSEQQMKEEALN